MFQALGFFSSFGLVTLAYGKEGIEFMQEQQRQYTLNRAAALILLGGLFWLMSFGFLISGMANKDSLLCGIVTVLFPAIYILWVARTRRKVEKEIIEASQQEEDRRAQRIEKDRQARLEFVRKRQEKLKEKA